MTHDVTRYTAWLEQGRAVDSRLVGGRWEHAFVAPKTPPAPPVPEPEKVSTDPDTAHTWLVSEYVTATDLMPVGIETHTDAELEALSELHSPRCCLTYQREVPWQAQRRHLQQLDLHDDGRVYQRLEALSGSAR